MSEPVPIVVGRRGISVKRVVVLLVVVLACGLVAFCWCVRFLVRMWPFW